MSAIAWPSALSSRATSKLPNDIPTVCIVTPVFNGEKFIDDTIASVLLQSGDFALHYHIQDGGSTDGTARVVRKWMRLHRLGLLPKLCRAVHFTFVSERDTGMYDAINRGFRRALPKGDDIVMGWIAADDRIAPGAFSTIFEIRRDNPDIRLVGGRVSLLDEAGSVTGVASMRGFSRRCMSAGLYDGRKMPFIMQEGTFWCSSLWHQVGGLDTRFRLAGDWDLWRRMASYAHYVSFDTVLGFHRRRVGQLSEHLDRYYLEVDRALDEPSADPALIYSSNTISPPEMPSTAPLRAYYDSIDSEYERMRVDDSGFSLSPHAATALRYDLSVRTWLRIEGFDSPQPLAQIVHSAGALRRYVVLPNEGFLPPQGAIPELGLLNGTRWMNAREAHGEVIVPHTARYVISLFCRNSAVDHHFALLADGRHLATLAPPDTGMAEELELRAECVLSAGWHKLTVEIVKSRLSENFLLLTSWNVEECIEPSESHPTTVDAAPIALSARIGEATFASHWPRISVVVVTSNDAQVLDDTLKSVLRQGYPNLELILVDNRSKDETGYVIDAYVHAITHLLSEPNSGPAQAINKGLKRTSGEILTWLRAGDQLCEAALHAMAFAFRSGADMVAGCCEVFDGDTGVMQRRLPCLMDGPLSLEQLLDVRNVWLPAAFFDRPAMFFTRGLFDRAGGSLDEALHHAMDYELWVRMASVGATILTIGHPTIRRHAPQQGGVGLDDRQIAEILDCCARLRTLHGFGEVPERSPRRRRLNVAMVNEQGLNRRSTAALTGVGRALALLGHRIAAYSGESSRRFEDGQIGAGTGAPDLLLLDAPVFTRTDLAARVTAEGRSVAVYVDEHVFGSENLAALAERMSQQAVKLALTVSDNHRDLLRRSTTDPELRVETLRRGVDVQAFTPGNRWHARKLLRLPEDPFVIFAGGAHSSTRDSIVLLMEAIGRLPDTSSVLLVVTDMEQGAEKGPCPVIWLGTDQHVGALSLYHQAADIFVALDRDEVLGQAVLEAGACGVPSVSLSDDVNGTIVDGVTGLVVGDGDPAAIADAIQKLRSDFSLRRRLGAHARLHVVNDFSLEASAAVLQRLLVQSERPRLDLVPAVDLAPANAEPKIRFPLESDPSHAWVDSWTPLSGVSSEYGDALLPQRLQRFWRLEGSSVLLLRSEKDGEHVIQLSGKAAAAAATVEIRVNDELPQAVVLAPGASAVTGEVRVAAKLTKGLNRIDIAFSDAEDAALSGTAFLLEALATWPQSYSLSGNFVDGIVTFGAGFGTVEGPFPELGLPQPFRWALGRRSQLWLRSAVKATRWIELTVRNNHVDQWLTVRLGGLLIGSFGLYSNDIAETIRLHCRAAVEMGDQPITIESARVWPADAAGRETSFILEDVSFLEQDPGVAPDRVRWDISEGFGDPESVAGQRPFRWVTGARARIVVDRNTNDLSQLKLRYRSLQDGQRARCSVNGQQAPELIFDNTGMSEGSEVVVGVPLESGRNVIDLTFGKPLPIATDDRELYIIVDGVVGERLTGAS